MHASDKGSNGSRRRGFTLAEVMIASSVMFIVLSVTFSVFLTAQRVLEHAMAQTQLAFELRMLREKLLFRVDAAGGLMSSRQSSVALDDVDAGWGNALAYTPVDAATGNEIVLDTDTRRLDADAELSPAWLSSGQMTFRGGRPFRLSQSAGTIEVDADVELAIGRRVYTERQTIRSEIMSR